MPFALGPVAEAAGYRLIAHETIDSTSSEAIRLALDGDPGRLWIVAGEQSNGHGRRGRAWLSPNGNLAASLLMPVGRQGAATATLGFAAGLALDAAVCAVAPELAGKVNLKWPNDVLIDGAKVGGILLEAVSPPDAPDGVVIGIGVNTRHAPEGLPYPATSLAEHGSEVEAETLFAALAEAWVEQESLWNAGRGFPAVRERWLTRAAGLGAPVSVRLGAERISGTFETIDHEGRLVVRLPAGTARSISAGDVYFGNASSSEF
jgi:BirA family biotin operon repressor/biotin-[acetyl-CoA-carboxylase] ligase